MRVLIVDDHVMFAESLARLLVGRDDITEVVVADSVGALRSSAEQVEPDVAVVDWQLGDGRAPDAVAALRQRSPEVRVIALTDARAPQIEHEAMASSCSGVLTKDRAIDELFDAIETSAGGERSMSPAAPSTTTATRITYTDLLSNRELDVVRAISRGMSNAEIADELYLSVNTVRNHIQRISAKLGVGTRLGVAMAAIRRDLIELPREETAG